MIAIGTPPHAIIIGHPPRTNGDVLAALISNLAVAYGNSFQPSHVESSLSHAKHRGFRDAEINCGAKLFVCFRRLPNLLLSWMVMCSGKLREEDEMDDKQPTPGVFPLFKPFPVITKEQTLNINSSVSGLLPDYNNGVDYGGNFATLGDFLIKPFAPDRLVGVVRLEHWKEDVYRMLSNIHFCMDPELWSQICTETSEGLSDGGVKFPFRYDKDPFNFWSKDEIKMLYDNNPLWANLERKYYGNLLCD